MDNYNFFATNSLIFLDKNLKPEITSIFHFLIVNPLISTLISLSPTLFFVSHF